jgi:hypothetical protein
VPTKAGSTEPYPEIVGPSGQKFQVQSLTLEFNPGLYVSEDQPDSDDEGDTAAGPATHQVSCGEVSFGATVRFGGDAGWKIGWVQTAEAADFWALYQQDERAARHRRTLEKRMKDGDSKGCWYGDESRQKANPGAAVTVTMNDDPNISFCYPHHPGGASLEALKGWAPAECGGQKEFWTWLVAVREDAKRKPAEMVYLHHIHWKAVFVCQVGSDAGQPTVTCPAGSGAILLDQDVGPGKAAPVLDGPAPRPSNEVNKVEPVARS